MFNGLKKIKNGKIKNIYALGSIFSTFKFNKLLLLVISLFKPCFIFS